MEQRSYRGNITPAGLADFLVQHFDPQHNLQAQKIGQGDSWVVQIGHGDHPEDRRHAVSVAIARQESGDGVLVTMGQQQWITSNMATHAMVIGLIGLVVTPWALFGLLWPLGDAMRGTNLVNDIWEAITMHAASQGATLAETRDVPHPGTPA